jgi:hypothetical protein
MVGPGARLHERAVLRLPALRRLEEGQLAVGRAWLRPRTRRCRFRRRGSADAASCSIPRGSPGSPLPLAARTARTVTLAPTGMAVLDGVVVRTRPESGAGGRGGARGGADRLRAAAGAAPEEAVGLALFAPWA